MILLFQDLVGFWEKIADQGIAIAVLALILFFVLVLVIKVLPTWERIKASDSAATLAQAKSLGELASSQNLLASSQTQMVTVVREVAIEQRQSTDAVKILQRVNARSNEQLASDVQGLTETLQNIDVQKFTETLQDFNERLSRLENDKNAGNK